MRTIRALIAAMLLAGGLLSEATAQLDYSNGFAGAPGGVLAFQGSATIAGGALRLTGGLNPETGVVYTLGKQNITSFRNHFQFQILTSMHGAESVMADGITFTIQNTGPYAWFGGGGGLAVAHDRHTTPQIMGLSNNVTVKFDVYNNEGEGFSSTGLYTRGVPPTVPATNLIPYGIDLQSHHLFDVTMDYNGTVLNVTILDTKTGASANHSYTVDIPAVVGGTTAYIGFTSGQGSVGARQTVLMWEWNRTAPRVVRVSTAGSDANDGSSWGAAVRTIQRGLNLAAAGGAGSEVWVAQGTYAEHVTVPAGVALYGGFGATESDLSQRNITAYKSIIDGSGFGVGVTTQGGRSNRVDGFTIRNCQRAITTDNSSPFLANNTITGNSNAWGTGIAGDNSSPIVANNTISNNVSVGDGGGILVTGAGGGIAHPYITQNTIANNSASGSQSNGYGGGLVFWRCLDVIIATNDIRGNFAKFGGGGVHINSENRGGTTVCRNVFDGNTAGTWGGGGLDTVWTTFVCAADNQFYRNHSDAGGAGGFMINQSRRAKVVRNTLEVNHGKWQGGGLILDVPDMLAWWNLFHNNESISHAGGLDVTRVGGTVAYNTFWDNFGRAGGGLRVGDSSPAVMNNHIVGNQSGWASGGLDLWNSSSTVANNLFFGNNGVWGGGISMGYSTPRIINNTLAYNHGPNNAGINIYLSSPEIANNIIAFSDTAAVGGYNETQPNPNIHHNLTYGWGGGIFNFAPGPGNLSFDPLFVNPAAGDFALQPWSQAIDQGNNASAIGGWPALNWNPRILNGTVDLGAWESSSARRIDNDAPVTTATPTPAPNGAGWNNTDVTVSLNATDGAGIGVKEIVYSLSGAQSGGSTVAGSAATIPVTTEGVTTITFHAVDLLGNVETDKSITIRIDKTSPTVTYSGARAYTVDETVNVTYTATDALSGIASDTGDTVVSVPAYQLALGEHMVNATATDKAGNTGSATATYTIGVTYESLCALVDRWCDKEGVHNSLCVKLRNAAAAEARGDLNAKAGLIGAFVHEVEAQSGKSIAPDKAEILIRLAQAL